MPLISIPELKEEAARYKAEREASDGRSYTFQELWDEEIAEQEERMAALTRSDSTARHATPDTRSVIRALQSALSEFQDGDPRARNDFILAARRMKGMSFEQASEIWFALDNQVATNRRDRLDAQDTLIPILRSMGYWDDKGGIMRELTPKQASRRKAAPDSTSGINPNTPVRKYDTHPNQYYKEGDVVLPLDTNEAPITGVVIGHAAEDRVWVDWGRTTSQEDVDDLIKASEWKLTLRSEGSHKRGKAASRSASNHSNLERVAIKQAAQTRLAGIRELLYQANALDALGEGEAAYTVRQAADVAAAMHDLYRDSRTRSASRTMGRQAMSSICADVLAVGNRLRQIGYDEPSSMIEKALVASMTYERIAATPATLVPGQQAQQTFSDEYMEAQARKNKPFDSRAKLGKEPAAQPTTQPPSSKINWVAVQRLAPSNQTAAAMMTLVEQAKKDPSQRAIYTQVAQHLWMSLQGQFSKMASRRKKS